MPLRFGGLWRHPDFLKLWAGQTISVFGSLITGLALPLVAILSLTAGPLEVAILNVAGVAPGLLIGLVAGLWVDRLHRRPLLVAADLARAFLLASIPVAAVAGMLRIEHLYLVAALTSALGMLFEVAYRAYLPDLLRSDQLVEGNSRLAASNSVAEVSGFGLAGLLVQFLTAPIALAVDAATFLISAASLLRIRARETEQTGLATSAPPTWRDYGAGLAWVWRQPYLRALAAANMTSTTSAHIFVAVMMLFFVRELGLTSALIGIIFAIGGVSSLPGALLAGRAIRHWGIGPTLIGSFLVNNGVNLSMALAAGPPPMVAAMVALPQLTDGAGTIYDIASTSLIQTQTPSRWLGRVVASLHLLEGSGRLLGLMLGGVLGELLGLRTTFLIGAIGTLLASLWLVLSPLSRLGLPDETASAGAGSARAE